MDNTRSVTRSLGFWALVAVAAVVGGVVLSTVFEEPGSGNDPLLAEIGNVGQLVAAAALVVIAVVAAVRAVRTRRSPREVR